MFSVSKIRKGPPCTRGPGAEPLVGSKGEALVGAADCCQGLGTAFQTGSGAEPQQAPNHNRLEVTVLASPQNFLLDHRFLSWFFFRLI